MLRSTCRGTATTHSSRAWSRSGNAGSPMSMRLFCPCTPRVRRPGRSAPTSPVSGSEGARAAWCRVNEGNNVVAQDGRDWTTPGAFEVSPDVYRIPLPLPNDGLRAVNVYAVADGQRVVLIDGGWALKESEELLARSLDTIGYGLEHISTCLVPHAHRDHYPRAIAVRRKFGARVGIGVGERFNIDPLAPPADPPELAQLRLLEAAGAAVVASELHRLR